MSPHFLSYFIGLHGFIYSLDIPSSYKIPLVVGKDISLVTFEEHRLLPRSVIIFSSIRITEFKWLNLFIAVRDFWKIVFNPPALPGIETGCNPENSSGESSNFNYTKLQYLRTSHLAN